MKETVIKEFKTWVLTQHLNQINYIKTAACYIRVSTDKQDEFSPISQLKIIWEYCNKNNMYLDLDKIYIEDEGVSGKYASKRIEFQNMIATAKSQEKPFDVIVVWKFSRFARNSEESIVYKNLLSQKNNIDVVSVSEPIPEGPFGDLIERIIEWADEYYLTNLSVEVKRGMTEKAAKGGLQSSPAFGYDVKNNVLVENEEESKYLKLIFDMYANENKTMIEIANILYKMGVHTKRGRYFENRTIYYILRNPVYIGKIRWTPTGKTKWDFKNPNSIISDGKHKPLIDISTWEKTQKKLDSNINFGKSHIQKNKVPSIWLRGLIRCSECGATMIKLGDHRLRCNGYNKGRCTNSKTILIKDAEELIINQLKQDITENISIKLKPIEKIIKDDKKLLLVHQLESLKKAEERIKEAYMNGIDTMDEYKENKLNIQNKKNEIKKMINNIPNENNENEKRKRQALENGKKLYEVLNDKNIDVSKKWELAHFTISNIVFDGINNELTLFYN